MGHWLPPLFLSWEANGPIAESSDEEGVAGGELDLSEVTEKSGENNGSEQGLKQESEQGPEQGAEHAEQAGQAEQADFVVPSVMGPDDRASRHQFCCGGLGPVILASRHLGITYLDDEMTR